MSGHLDSQDLARYIQRGLSAAELLAADEHLRDCADCRRRLAGVAEWPQGLGGTSAAPGPADHLSFEQLARYVEARLIDLQRQNVDRHVETCGMCRAELEDLMEFTRDPVPEPRSAAAPDRFEARVVKLVKDWARQCVPDSAHADIDVDRLVAQSVAEALMQLDVIERNDLGASLYRVRDRARELFLAMLQPEDREAIASGRERGLGFGQAAADTDARSTSVELDQARFRTQRNGLRNSTSDS